MPIGDQSDNDGAAIGVHGLGLPPETRLTRVSRTIALLVAGFGTLVLAGWALDVTLLKSILPGWASMKPNTALCFVLAAASLWFVSPDTSPRQAVHGRRLGRALAAIVGLVAVLTACEYAFDLDLGIDRWLIDDTDTSLHPGRMALATAYNFILLSVSLLLLDVETRGGGRPSHWLALLMCANLYVACLGYLYGVEALYRYEPYGSLALHSALAFILLGIGAIIARPRSHLVRQIAGQHAAGAINRRLLPIAVLVPPMIGWLRWNGELAGYYETPIGLALSTAIIAALFSLLVWWAAAAQRRDELRIAARNLELVNRERRLSEAQHIGKIGDWEYELESGKVTWSAQVYALYERDPALGPPGLEEFQSQLEDRYRKLIDRQLARVVSTGEAQPYDLTVTLPSGRVAHHAAIASPILGPAGTIIAIRGIVQDVTERKQAELALAASETRLRTIIDTEPECVKLLASDGALIEMNPAGLRMLEADSLQQVKDHCVYSLVAEEHRQAFRDLNQRVFAGGSGTMEFQVTGLKGGQRWLETHASPLRDGSGKIIALLGITRDITERKAARILLIESERRLRQVVDGMGPHMFVGLMDTAGTLLMANKPVRDAASLAGSDVIGKPFPDAYWWRHDNAERQRLQMAIRRAAGGESIRYDVQIRVAEAELLWIDFSIQPLRDESGQVSALVPSAVLIEDRKHVEQDLRTAIVRQKKLARRLVEAQEVEQRQISAELHDRIGQNLTALSINLNIIEGQGDAAANAARLQDSQELLQSTIASVRDLITDLRPAALDEYGLLVALRLFAARFGQRSGLVVSVSGEEGAARLAARVENALFRISQEALTNIAKHARARAATLDLQVASGVTTLVISDDGIGFDPSTGRGTVAQQGWGLDMMRERAHAVGAQLQVNSTPGRGTQVLVRLEERP